MSRGHFILFYFLEVILKHKILIIHLSLSMYLNGFSPREGAYTSHCKCKALMFSSIPSFSNIYSLIESANYPSQLHVIHDFGAPFPYLILAL